MKTKIIKLNLEKREENYCVNNSLKFRKQILKQANLLKEDDEDEKESSNQD